jgi:DNA-binding SARP family transcriptional activator/Tfp pilus assembly protein PilF/DNA-binding XRE family transcriptional regulator
MRGMDDDSGAATFGEALLASRRLAGLTQEQVAERSGVSVRSVRDIERGRVGRPRRVSAQRLAAAVGMSPEARPPVRPARGGDLRIGDLQIEVLGPLVASRGGHTLRLGARKHRSLLALLALQPNEVVPRDEIVDALWGDHPPASSNNLVHTYVSRLRRALEPGRTEPSSVLREAGGYRLSVGAAELDLLRFGELAGRAGNQADEDPAGALALFGQALRCWRGPVLAGLPESVRRHPIAVAAADRRIAAALSAADLSLALGADEDIVSLLRPLLHEEPLHEGLHARLMLTLAAAGRQADALELYRRIRGRLIDELGIDPGSEIQSAYLRIVRNTVPARQKDPGAPRPERGRPAQLPADIAGLVGRDDCLARLDRTLRQAEPDDDPAMIISAIEGTAGVGKTALAVHWAHRVRDRFPDGQLYTDLGGYAPTSPSPPLQVLTRFLRAVGVPAERVPRDIEEAASLYRTRLADRKMLILLDNAADSEQVRPLLPGGPGCLVLVTSRNRLSGLAAKEGAYRLALDVLDPGDARALLTRMLGAERVRAEPGAVAELGRACAYLPLALRIAAANLISVPHGGVAAYTADLRARGRLAGLVTGDGPDAVRAAFDLSYERLLPGNRRMFRLLGLVPGPDFSAAAAAALIAGTLPATRKSLGVLATANLIQESVPGRFQFHDLLREYAAELAVAQDGVERSRAAVGRLFDGYLRAADVVGRRLYPHARHTPDPAAGNEAPGSAWFGEAGDPDEAGALRWLDAERANLFAAATHAADFGAHHYAWRIADVLRGYLWTRGCNAEGLAACEAGLRAARESGDLRAEASMCDILGMIHYNLSDYPRSITWHTRALELSTRTGDRAAEAGSLHNLGRVQSQLGRPVEQADFHERALAISRELGDRHGEGRSLNYVGAAALSAGQVDKAYANAVPALEISRQIGDRDLEARSLHNLGLTQWTRGKLTEALDYFTECLTIARSIGVRHGEAPTMVCLAETNCDAGRYAEAEAQARTGIAQGRETGERRHEANGLDVLATVQERLGRHEAAFEYYHQALRIAREVGLGYGDASVLCGLSTVLRGLGRPTEAIEHAREALDRVHGSGLLMLECRALTGLAHGLLELGEAGQAEIEVERALRTATDAGQLLGEARALRARGLIRQAAGRRDEARTDWRAALDVFTQAGAAEATGVAELLGQVG